MERLGSRKGKKSIIVKVFERCRSLGHRRSSSTGRQRAPEGCFTVYVGPTKERFVVRMECVNHPLFRMLLDEAEMVYGFTSPGPLQLPCDVDVFNKILCEMDQEMMAPPSCGFAKCYSTGYRLLSPPRLIVADHL
ncbi:Auxin responsive protein [Musa troglodytarum]|uniref:Auxin responsive protein n=1 Tax=Musa troglodytarum TaxID=320322 RepID=A0A9E7JHR2_9LILI|nr:Auxin responsive protein [Musa troglodytarum]